MLQIWNNHFISNRKLLLQVLVDGYLWQLDENGNYEAILMVNDVEHEHRGGVFLVGDKLLGWERIH